MVETDIISIILTLLLIHVSDIRKRAIFKRDTIRVKSGYIKGKRNRSSIVHKVPIDTVAEIAVPENAIEMFTSDADYPGSS